MLNLEDDNGKQLPKKTQERVNAFINNLKNVPWFNPSSKLKREEVDKQIKFTLECFGVKAGIEYRKLEKREDWASARDFASESAWTSAWVSALESARAFALDSAWASDWAYVLESVWASALESTKASAWVSASASVEILLEGNKQFSSKYPNGAFKQLFKIWEMGLYPVGVLEDNKKFVVYVPPREKQFPFNIN